MNYDILKPYENEIIAFEIQALQAVVSYYENNYLPELSETTGKSQTEHLHSAKEDLKKLKYDAKFTDFKYLDISRASILNCLRANAIKCRETAQDFPKNKILVIRFLRKTVKYIQTLIILEPKLEIYSNHWIASRNPITVK